MNREGQPGRNAVGNFSANNGLRNIPAHTQRASNQFRSIVRRIEAERTVAEVLLETAITAAAVRVGHAATPEEARDAWGELCRLHRQRSDEFVSRLEKSRGLR